MEERTMSMNSPLEKVLEELETLEIHGVKEKMPEQIFTSERFKSNFWFGFRRAENYWKKEIKKIRDKYGDY